MTNTVELQNLIGVIAATLQTHEAIIEALHIAELDTLDSDEAIAAATAAVTALLGPRADEEQPYFVLRDDGLADDHGYTLADF
jgi:hypothetical protein